MSRRWLIVLSLVALIGCELSSDPAGPTQRPGMERMARINERMSRLQMEVGERELRIKELSDHVQQLSARLKKLEFINQQLTQQLAVVGGAPRDRDRYKQLTVRQSLEMGRLRQRILQLQRRLSPTTAPATQPAGSDGD
jgi:chromosome segregation ATPase